MKSQRTVLVILAVVAAVASATSITPAEAAGAKKKAPDGVVMEIKNPKQGKVVRRKGAKARWAGVSVLQSLYVGDHLAVEGKASTRIYLFGRTEKFLNLSKDTASKKSPYLLRPDDGAKKKPSKLARGLSAIASTLGANRDPSQPIAPVGHALIHFPQSGQWLTIGSSGSSSISVTISPSRIREPN